MPKKTSTKELEQKIGELTEALQRERADAENVRKRAETDKLQLADFYKSMIVRELLPALDNLERALKHVPKDLEGNDYVKGIQGVIKQFEQSFAQLGVEKIKTVGEHFDPKLHEAISIEDGDGHEEVVCEELAPGYKMGGEVIRHAMVKVKREGK